VLPLVHKADFERLLAVPVRSRSAHFACHHAAGAPFVAPRRTTGPVASELSTGDAPAAPNPVDDSPGQWAGSVVPKRHARRSVTRSLLKRQIRAALARHAGALPQGLWLVRLKAPFVTAQFPSAASDALRLAARQELDLLLARAGA
jgi:ribonuclease P protein component